MTPDRSHSYTVRHLQPLLLTFLNIPLLTHFLRQRFLFCLQIKLQKIGQICLTKLIWYWLYQWSDIKMSTTPLYGFYQKYQYFCPPLIPKRKIILHQNHQKKRLEEPSEKTCIFTLHASILQINKKKKENKTSWN